jgi:hypothetical protein
VGECVAEEGQPAQQYVNADDAGDQGQQEDFDECPLHVRRLERVEQVAGHGHLRGWW